MERNITFDCFAIDGRKCFLFVYILNLILKSSQEDRKLDSSTNPFREYHQWNFSKHVDLWSDDQLISFGMSLT